MPNVKHFAVTADDVERARSFYSEVFGWEFEDWGPPNFYRVHTGTEDDPGIFGALEERRERVDGKPPYAFICTVGVDDVDATARRIEAAGGKITMPKTEIPTVGWLIQFTDTEGNVVNAMKYHYTAR